MKGWLLIVVVCAAHCFSAVRRVPSRSENYDVLHVGIPAHWGTLEPVLQKTALGDALLSSQFETLVDLGQDGIVRPLLARSWTVSDDGRTYTFRLDNERRFSDGSILSAMDVVECWERGFAKIPLSNNKGTMDVFYLLEGVQSFATTGKLSALRALDPHTISVSFKKPFRLALEHLAGRRYAIYKATAQTLLGTGSYVISERGPDTLALRANPFTRETLGFRNIQMQVIAPEQAVDALHAKRIDMYVSAGRRGVAFRCSDISELACLGGLESSHWNIAVNALPGRIFEKRELRLALQSVFANAAQSARNVIPSQESYLKEMLSIDPQVYLSFQNGRLSDKHARELLSAGDAHIESLRRATKHKYLEIVYPKQSVPPTYIFETLDAAGIHFLSKAVDLQQIATIGYKTSAADLVINTRSVVVGDPDGLYHALGRHGALGFPMEHRDNLEAAFEAGRSLLDPAAIDQQYQKVSEVVLQEVPWIHLGFLSDFHIYHKERLTPTRSLVQRVGVMLSGFRPREQSLWSMLGGEP